MADKASLPWKGMFISIKPNISIMEDMVGMFAQKMGIPPELARMGLSLVSKFFIQNSNPNEASGLLSSLPRLSDMFSDDERRQFTTRQCPTRRSSCNAKESTGW
jgi:hypothetical protein